MIDRDAIRRINHAVRLPDLIPHELRSRRSTDTQFFANCPFHEDSTASLSVTYKRDRGWCYNCFGCGEVGDVIKFVQKLHGLTFKQVIAQYGGGEADERTTDHRLAVEATRWFDQYPDFVLACDTDLCFSKRDVRKEDYLNVRQNGTHWSVSTSGRKARCWRCTRTLLGLDAGYGIPRDAETAGEVRCD